MDKELSEQFAKVMISKMTPEWHEACREASERKREGRCVYFIIDCNLVKIGFSKYPEFRLDQIKTSRPRAILLGYVKGGCQLEREIHRKLTEYKYDREWFFYEPEVERIIAEYLK